MIDVATVEIISDCNNACIWCYAKDLLNSRRKMSVETFESVLSFLEAAGCKVIVFTGGEPTLHPLLPDFIKKSWENRVERISVVSNGCGYTDAFLDEIEECREFVSLNVSLHGAEASIHDAITGRSGSYDLLLSGVKRAVARGFVVCAQMTLCQENRNELSAILALTETLHINDLLVNFCRKPINAAFRADDFLSVAAFSEEVANGVRSYSGNVSVQVGPLLPLCKLAPVFRDLMETGRIRLKKGCGMMDNQLVIDTEGKLLLCAHLSEVKVGSVDTFEDVRQYLEKIDKDIKRQFRQYPWAKCIHCEERKLCVMGGCLLLRLKN